MKILIACEFSGVVRDAFIRMGHCATSCDFLPSEREGSHLQGDVREYLAPQWDMMIAFPPCTYLANSGVRWLYGRRGKKIDEVDPERWASMQEAARFFKLLLEAPIPRIALENPIMHCHAREIVGEAPSQVVQPWQFGHGETKATCFWLRNLPPLRPTNIVKRRSQRVHFESPGPDRWKDRIRTLEGMAEAMATQWP